MKRILSLLLISALFLSLCACGDGETAVSSAPSAEPSPSTEATESAEPSPSEDANASAKPLSVDEILETISTPYSTSDIITFRYAESENTISLIETLEGVNDMVDAAKKSAAYREEFIDFWDGIKEHALNMYQLSRDYMDELGATDISFAYLGTDAGLPILVVRDGEITVDTPTANLSYLLG